jgi:hypothetical protein
MAKTASLYLLGVDALYIEAFYNPKRRHSTLGMLSPADYERAQRTAISLKIEHIRTRGQEVASKVRDPT